MSNSLLVKPDASSSRPSEFAPYRTLDAWRGFASLWVAMLHMSAVLVERYPALRSHPIHAFALMGALGVQLFFVISGYCIINSACVALKQENSFRRFLWARVRRIYPPYWFALLCVAAFALLAQALIASHRLTQSEMAAKNIFDQGPFYYLSNFTLTHVTFRQPILLLPSWSLCYEIAFYLIVGLLLLPWAKRLRGERGILNLLHLLTAGCMLVLVVSPGRSNYPFDLWPPFGLGILVYDIVKHPNQILPKLSLLIVGGLIIAFAFLHSVQVGFLGNGGRVPFLVSLGFAFTLIVLYHHDLRLSRLAPVRALASVGLFSYSLYLTHIFSIGVVTQVIRVLKLPQQAHLLSWLIALIGAVAFARCFYHFCERPFIKSRRSNQNQATAPSQNRSERLTVVTHRVLQGDGQGRVNYEIVQEALRRGYEVTLVASEIAPELRAHARVSWVPISVAGWPTELIRNQVFALRSGFWLRKHRQAAGVLHVNGFITWGASDVNAVHFVHSAWLRSPMHTARIRHDGYGAYQWVYTALNAGLERRAYRQALTVVAVSERVRGQLLEIGVPENSIHVILNGVDLEEFYPHPGNRVSLELPHDVPLALFVGDIRTPRKNLDQVLRALVSVPDLHLMVAGATEGSPYPELAANLGLRDRVRFLGFRRDVLQLMRAADMFVFPSRYEACSLVLLEAMASGLPIVTAQTAGGAEIVTPECGVVLSDPDDMQGLITALRFLTEDPPRCRRMGQAARAIAEQHSWERMAKDYLRLYAEIVPSERQATPLRIKTKEVVDRTMT